MTDNACDKNAAENHGEKKYRIGVMTSGGDAPGMNAAVRAVVRTAMSLGGQVYGILNGYLGLQNPETGIVCFDRIKHDVAGIIGLGGTALGTARCKEMMEKSGRRKAVQALAERGIDRLVVIGGDGSLTGAETLREEWAEHIQSLIDEGSLNADTLEKHPYLCVVGLPGTIDNDLCGSDMTIGADTALHRIVDCIDCISSTAYSHQRTFVVEVMGRYCGYLAVMAGLATGSEWVLIPESPVAPGWEEQLGKSLSNSRANGKRAGIVVVAEGAHDTEGNHITSEHVRQVLHDNFGEDARVTILGHVQRGGAPSAYDRILSTRLGNYAAKVVMGEKVDPSVVIGMRSNRPVAIPLMKAVEDTRKAQKVCREGSGDEGFTLRSHSLADSFELFRVVNGYVPETKPENPRKIAIVHSGAPAPGMNMAVRTAVRWAISRGHQPIGVMGGFAGLARGDFHELGWMDVTGSWASEGGAKLGIGRELAENLPLFDIANVIRQNKIDALLMIGGWSGYNIINKLFCERKHFPFNIPMICLPASIDNNLPGSELSVGADTALNSIVFAVDNIKRSGTADKRCFLVEVMGYECGYLAQMAGMATGAEYVYLNEDPPDAQRMLADINKLRDSFDRGRRVALGIVNEKAHPVYSTGLMRDMFEAEGKFDTRQAILGHLQQGGDPTPFDRTLAARFARFAVDAIIEKWEQHSDSCGFIGLTSDGMKVWDFHDYSLMIDQYGRRRPKDQWWLDGDEVSNSVSSI
ncbi:MAG: 6-phosphofructokinase [bacterium]|nr:6-phosphofructokinase [bacterium]